MKLPPSANSRSARVAAFLVLGLLAGSPCNRLPAQTANTDSQSVEATLPQGAADALKLTRAGLKEDLVLTQIKSSGEYCQLSADQILCLSNAGVAQNVISALISGGTPAQAGDAVAAASMEPVPEPPPPVAAPEQASLDYFREQLSPYGNWVQAGNYGWCWSPAIAASAPGWRPYCDDGQWLYTDQGWYWESAYPWGEIAFHYGRWFLDPGLGWLWVPDYTWGPGWVCWRDAAIDGCCGWAPLPPGALFVPGFGLMWNGRLAMDADFGLGWDAFIFIGMDHFWGGGYRRSMVGRDRAGDVYQRSTVRNGYRLDGGRFVVEGPGRDRMAQGTHRDVRPAPVIDVIRARNQTRRGDVQRNEAVRPAVRSDQSRAEPVKAQPVHAAPAALPARPATSGQYQPAQQVRHEPPLQPKQAPAKQAGERVPASDSKGSSEKKPQQ